MISRGFYRHYKGDVYFVEGIGQSHSNLDAGKPGEARRWALYQSTQSCAPGDGITRMRPEVEFEQWVVVTPGPLYGEARWIDGLTEAEQREGVAVRGSYELRPRFARIEVPRG